MSQIDTFEKYKNALDESFDNINELELTDEEFKFLQNIALFNIEKLIKNADEVLQKYYSMKVPDDILAKILINDINLAYEAYTNSIGDTCQREILCDTVLQHIGMRPWPIYGEGNQVMEDFVNNLKEKVKDFNIELILDDEIVTI